MKLGGGIQEELWEREEYDQKTLYKILKELKNKPHKPNPLNNNNNNS